MRTPRAVLWGQHAGQLAWLPRTVRIADACSAHTGRRRQRCQQRLIPLYTVPAMSAMHAVFAVPAVSYSVGDRRGCRRFPRQFGWLCFFLEQRSATLEQGFTYAGQSFYRPVTE